MNQTATPLLQPFRVQVLRLRGELRLEDASKILELIKEYIQLGRVHVFLNLELVDHIELAGLPQLNLAAKRLREYGGDLKLVAATPYLRQLLDLAGVGKAFDLCGDEDEAAKRCGDTFKLKEAWS